MSRRLITVIYEDQLAGAKPSNYGPHVLLLACVADDMGRDRWELNTSVVANPKKGDSKLRAALREDGGLLAKTGPLVAMFDHDRVRDCYQLPSDACKRAVLEGIQAEASGEPRVVFLEENLEDVVGACCLALGRPLLAKKPNPADRDVVLQKAAAAEHGVRKDILLRVPSFARLVRVVVGALQEMHPAAAGPAGGLTE